VSKYILVKERAFSSLILADRYQFYKIILNVRKKKIALQIQTVSKMLNHAKNNKIHSHNDSAIEIQTSRDKTKQIGPFFKEPKGT
jgi:hypothetical protein